MKISVIRPHELDNSQIKNWNNIQQSEVSLASPYFCPAYTLAAGSCIEDVYVAVMEDNSKEIGYFPFQRNNRMIGGPVGSMLSDYQGVIIKNDAEWDASILIRECGLAVWDFDHLIASQKQFKSFYKKIDHSPIIDISDGFETYYNERRESGSKRIKKLSRMFNKLENDLAEVRVNLDEKDPGVLNQVFLWKTEQCQRTGVLEFFNLKWARELVERIFYIREQNFSGLLSAIHQGDNIVAAHMGMRSKNVMHYWFPTYNYEYSKYSPGAILLLQLIKELSNDEIMYIDLGKGDDQYKISFANNTIGVSEGFVMVPSFAASKEIIRRQLINYLRTSTLLTPAKYIYKSIRRNYQ